jgi:hypothetical protein
MRVRACVAGIQEGASAKPIVFTQTREWDGKAPEKKEYVRIPRGPRP